MRFTELPTEVLLHVCEEVNFRDLPQLMGSCQLLRGLINGNSVLYKQHYMKRWGNPSKKSTKQKELDWEKEVKEFMFFDQVIQSVKYGALADDRPFVAKVIASLMKAHEESHPANSDSDSEDDKRPTRKVPDSTPLNQFLRRSALYARALGFQSKNRTGCEIEKGRASAQIHCLFGLPQIEFKEHKIQMHPYAASKVYDMRNYKQKENGWGPFKDDGSWTVDWEKVEAVMLDIGYNISRLDPAHSASIESLWDDVLEESTFPQPRRRLHVIGSTGEGIQASISGLAEGPSTRNATKRLNTKLDELDPYGITGTYLRVVCFLDYRDLWDYNWGMRRPSGDRPMRLIHENEAIRMIVMSLVVTNIEWPDGQDHSDLLGIADDSQLADVPVGTKSVSIESSSSTDGIDTTKAAAEARLRRLRNIDKSQMPIVHFAGTSRAMHAAWDPNANSKIKGTVRMTPEGEVRWTTVSIFGGDEERWKSEGIQVGGIQSGRGIIGSWFDRNYDEHGPAGPTAFWKIRNEVPASLDEQGNMMNIDNDSEDDEDFMLEMEVDEDDDGEEEDEEEDDDNGNIDDEDNDDDDNDHENENENENDEDHNGATSHATLDEETADTEANHK